MRAKSKTTKTAAKSQAGRPDKAKARAEVAQFRLGLGVSEPTFADWRKIPGAPTTLNIEEWRAFVAEQGLGGGGGRGGRPGPAREEHLTTAVQMRNRLLQLEIAEKEGRMADRAEVDAMLTRVGTLQKTILYAKLERELPAKAVGRTAEEIAQLGREFADELADIFARGLEEWKDAQ